MKYELIAYASDDIVYDAICVRWEINVC